MKRPRNVAAGSRTVVARSRKAKGEVEVGVEKEKAGNVMEVEKEKEKEKARKMVEDREDSGKRVAVEAEVLVEAELEERPRLWSLADEQMSWGSFWCPSWDMDHLGTEAYNALYSDVVWDDDLWDLKGIKEVPNP